MRKIVKIGFPILSIAIILFTFGLMADIKGKVKEKKAEQGQTSEIVDNNLENNNENKVAEDTLINSKDDIYLRKAIQVLKNEITISENQYFTNEGEEDGKYIVALRDKETTEADIFYIVNVDTGEYEIYY